MSRMGKGSLRRAARWAALAVVAAAWSAVSPAALAQGCAMCRTAVEGIDDPLSRAFSYTTLFMLSMPFAVAATVGGWLVFTIRRGGAAVAAAAAADSLAASGSEEIMLEGAAEGGSDAARPAPGTEQEGMAL